MTVTVDIDYWYDPARGCWVVARLDSARESIEEREERTRADAEALVDLWLRQLREGRQGL